MYWCDKNIIHWVDTTTWIIYSLCFKSGGL